MKDPHKDTTKRIGDGSAHWPRVPAEAPRVDGTAQDTDRFDVDHELPGSGWRAWALWSAIALIFVAMLWLVLQAGGGGR